MSTRLALTFPLALTLYAVACGDAPNAETSTPAAAIAEAPRAGQPEEIVVTAQQFVASGFATGTMAVRGFRQNLNCTGQLMLPPEAQVLVQAPSGGVVRGLKLIEGESVRKGQTLFSVTAPMLLDLQREYLEVSARLEYLRDELARQVALDEAQVSARKNLSEARANLRVAETTRAAIGRQLQALGLNPARVSATNLVDRLAVAAPISGQVSRVFAANGQNLDRSAPAVELVSIKDMHLELHVLEKDIGVVRMGQSVSFEVAEGGQLRQAKVHLVAPLIDSLRRAMVHCDVAPASARGLLAGQFVQATVEVSSAERFALPAEAIVTQEGTQLALVRLDAAGTRYAPRVVRTGVTQDGYTAIENANDFAEGTVFLTKGAYFLVGVE